MQEIKNTLQRKFSTFGTIGGLKYFLIVSTVNMWVCHRKPRPLIVPLYLNHLFLAWSQKNCNICIALVCEAARAKWKCHIHSNEVHITHTGSCSSESYGEENKIMIFIHMCFSLLFCVGWRTAVSNPPLRVEGWWLLPSSSLSTFRLKPEFILLNLGQNRERKA